jgi:hypothetical protein
MQRRAMLLLIALAVAACGATSSALSGSSSAPALITPTPWPSSVATPFACGELPPEKCAISRRYEDDERAAHASWSAQVFRSYAPIPAVPFVASTPRPKASPPTPTPEASVRVCTASDLAGAYTVDNGAGGVFLRGVAIANTSATACGIRGKPSVRILLANRAAEATYAEATDGPLAVLSPNGVRPVAGAAPQPGVLSLVVGISRSCSFAAAGMSALLVILPGDVSSFRIDLPMRNLGEPAPTPIPSANCLDAPYFPQIGVWNIGVVVPSSGQSPALGVRAVVNAPAIAVAGETLRFEVTLVNEGGDALGLEPCPSYTISIGVGADRGRTERHMLNCAPVGQLAAHGSSTFAMEIAVPADWPVTLDGGLGWSLDGYAAGVKLPLAIARRG